MIDTFFLSALATELTAHLYGLPELGKEARWSGQRHDAVVDCHVAVTAGVFLRSPGSHHPGGPGSAVGGQGAVYTVRVLHGDTQVEAPLVLL